MAFSQIVPLITNILGRNSDGIQKLSQGFSTAQKLNQAFKSSQK